MKTNFTAKSAKSFRTNVRNESKGMNHALKAVVEVWNRKTNDQELNASIQAAKDDGLTVDNFSAQFIIDNLNGSRWCKDGVIGSTNKAGEFTAKSAWTSTQVVDYVRRANKARLEAAAAKSEKESEQSK